MATGRRRDHELVPLAALIGRELKSEKMEKPSVRFGSVAEAKKGEDYLMKPDCQRVPGNPSSTFSVFADLKNPILFNAIKAFNSLRIRVGGSLQDEVIYKVGANHPRCQTFRPDPQGMFGFTSGCLTSCRWDKLNDLFNKTGCLKVVLPFY